VGLYIIMSQLEQNTDIICLLALTIYRYFDNLEQVVEDGYTLNTPTFSLIEPVTTVTFHADGNGNRNGYLFTYASTLLIFNNNALGNY
jgi:hypothetical protein